MRKTASPRLLPLALAVMLGCGMPAANPASAAPANAVASADGATRATLDNGLRVVIVPDRLAPMVTTQITYLAGGYETPVGQPGSAHALEHMMFRDSRGMTGAQLNEMTGKMGADNNAFTTSDATQYYFVAPAQYLDLLLHIESTRMRGALMTDKDWALEKGAIEQEVSRDISDPGYLAFADAERALFAGTGYAEDALGTRPSFDRTTAKDLRAFHDAWYQPNNAILVIVGDVDPQATLAQVKQLFGTIPAHPLPARVPLVLQPFSAKTIARTTPDATGSVQFLYRMPGQRSPDFAASQLLMDALSNARSGLSDLAATGKVLSTSAGAQPFSNAGIGYVAVGFPKGGDAAAAQAAMDAQIARVLKDGVPADLVEAARRAELAQFEFNKNSAVTQASAWSQALAWQGLDSPAQAEQQIRAVTVDDVNRVARQWLKADQRVTVVLTPDPNGKRPPDSNGFGGSEKFGSDDKLDAPLPEWAATALAKLDMPHWTLAPQRMTLANGITLIVQPETVSKTVTVVGHVDHDASLQEAPGKEGIARVLNALFDYGTTTLDRTAFHKALDDIAANASGGSDFNLAVPSEGFDRGMALLADNELHPALPAAAFTVQQQTLSRTLAGELQSPSYQMFRALKKGLLPAGDPALREATPATVDKLALQDAKDYYASTFRPDMTTIVVVGDVTPEQARATVEKYFGGWKAQGPKPSTIPAKVPLNPPSYTVVPNAYASQDQVLMAQTLGVDLANPDRFALTLGNDVLGGNGFASRLMTDIRVKHGFAYGAGSGMQFDRSRSVFYVQYGSDPGKVGPVDALVQQNLRAMQNQPVSKTELDNARQYEIRSIPVSVSSVERIARELLAWSWKGLPLDEPMVAARHYLDMSAQQVQDAFRKHIDPDHLVQVVQGPAPEKH
ncbi:MAG: insulinase family protein [Proteobacteria bacterium]|nr:insulinase family protein [Pseudomonadota bacterium]